MMRIIFITLTFYILIVSNAFATHIVGGELELTHLGDSTYALRLLMYFDDVNGNPGAEDQTLTIGIFRKSDNASMDTIILDNLGSSQVPYTNPDCSIPILATRRIIYSSQIILSPNEYDDPQGYYAAWDRCCRNNVIDNLFLPGEQGQLFYLEFPPVSLNGQPLINSSPILFPPVSDYACVNEFFYFDFSGSDPDGDSLVYSLVAPLSGFSSTSIPVFPEPRPGPYPSVFWNNNFGVANMIPGNPPLSITPSGELQVIPSQVGLFVFAIKCEELRNGVKIGEVRRDFQIYVQNCPSNEAPVISNVQDPITNLPYVQGDTMFFDLNNRCLDFYISDADANTDFEMSINSINFDDQNISISPENGVINQPGDSVKIQICFSECAVSDTAAFKFEIILSDDGCSLPKKDTLFITAVVDAIPNIPPSIFNNLINDTVAVKIGDTLSFNVFGRDTDNDSIILEFGDNTFNPSAFNMQFPRVIGLDTISSTFSWSPNCQALSLNGQNIVFQVSDYICTNLKTLIRIPIMVESDNSPPIISSNKDTSSFLFNLNDTLLIDLNVQDLNPSDELRLRYEIFDPQGNKLNFLNTTIAPISGITNLNSTFNWMPDCGILNYDSLSFLFISDDDGCSSLSDSLFLTGVPVYDNTSPILTLLNTNIGGKISQEIYRTIYSDSSLVLNFDGFDIDNNPLMMSLSGQSDFSESIPLTFEAQSGIGESSSTITVGPGICLESNEIDRQLVLYLNEESCENLKDSVIIYLTIEELFDSVKMPNVITPNGDGLNDYFAPMQLPRKCKFMSIDLFNRWGRRVWSSSDEAFKWYADEVPAGDYFYSLTFENTSYKGVLKILK